MDYKALLKKYMVNVYDMTGFDAIVPLEDGPFTEEEYDALCELSDDNGFTGLYGPLAEKCF